MRAMARAFRSTAVPIFLRIPRSTAFTGSADVGGS
jgi:hypothetical protein